MARTHGVVSVDVAVACTQLYAHGPPPVPRDDGVMYLRKHGGKEPADAAAEARRKAVEEDLGQVRRHGAVALDVAAQHGGGELEGHRRPRRKVAYHHAASRARRRVRQPVFVSRDRAARGCDTRDPLRETQRRPRPRLHYVPIRLLGLFVENDEVREAMRRRPLANLMQPKLACARASLGD